MMRAILVALAMVVGGAAWAQSVPQFREFATGPMYGGPRSAPDLSSRESYDYRTRLRAAAPLEPNFASDQRAVTWGCGTSCQTGAIINQRTGLVVFFPFSICCSAKQYDAGFNSIEFRRNSSLIVFSGQRNEEGVDGAHFYEFNGRGFQFLLTLPFSQPQPAPSASAQPSTGSSASVPPSLADEEWIKRPLASLGYCIRPKVQYGQYSSYDGGKSVLDLLKSCIGEYSLFDTACMENFKSADDAKGKCSLLLAASVQLMIREFGK